MELFVEFSNKTVYKGITYIYLFFSKFNAFSKMGR